MLLVRIGKGHAAASKLWVYGVMGFADKKAKFSFANKIDHFCSKINGMNCNPNGNK